MLRITEKAVDTETTFIVVEGRITGSAARDLLDLCREKLTGEMFLTLDLSPVSFVDREGIHALAVLRRCGAHVIGCSILVNQLLDLYAQTEERDGLDTFFTFGLTVSEDCPE